MSLSARALVSRAACGVTPWCPRVLTAPPSSGVLRGSCGLPARSRRRVSHIRRLCWSTSQKTQFSTNAKCESNKCVSSGPDATESIPLPMQGSKCLPKLSGSCSVDQQIVDFGYTGPSACQACERGLRETCAHPARPSPQQTSCASSPLVKTQSSARASSPAPAAHHPRWRTLARAPEQQHSRRGSARCRAPR